MKKLVSLFLLAFLASPLLAGFQEPWVTHIGEGNTQFIGFDIVTSTPSKAVRGATYWSGLDFKVNVGTQKNPSWRYLRPDATASNMTLDNATIGTLVVSTLLDVNEDVDIDFDATDEEFDITSTTGPATAAGSLVTIYTSTGVINPQMYLLRLRYFADGDADGDFIVCEDNNGDDKFTVSDEGNLVSAGSGIFSGTLLSVADGKGGVGVTPKLNVVHESASSGIAATCWEESASHGAFLNLRKSDGGAEGTHSALDDNDLIGGIAFNISDGSNFEAGALIHAEVDGTVGSNDTPAALVFSTCKDGEFQPTEAMRIEQDLSTVLSGALEPYSRTEAQLKASTPSVAGQCYFDSTNNAVVVSTGTGWADFGQIQDGSTAPTGW